MRVISAAALAIVTIRQEAGTEPYQGKLAVGAVIRNRMKAHSFWSDGTVEGTVLKPYQFSGWNTGTPDRISSVRLDDGLNVGPDCARAWNESVSIDPTHGALLYYNPAVVATPNWVASSILVATIGGHQFYAPAPNRHGRVFTMAAHMGRHLPRLRAQYAERVSRVGRTRAKTHSDPPACCSLHKVR